MKVCITGNRDLAVGLETVEKAIAESGFPVTEFQSGGGKGLDEVVEKLAFQKKIPVKVWKIDWKSLDVPGAIIKSGGYGDYNSNAPTDRDKKLAAGCEAVIVISNGGSAGLVARTARDLGKTVFEYDVSAGKQDSDYIYTFGCVVS